MKLWVVCLAVVADPPAGPAGPPLGRELGVRPELLQSHTPEHSCPHLSEDAQCGAANGGRICTSFYDPNWIYCSTYGWCGNTADYQTADTTYDEASIPAGCAPGSTDAVDAGLSNKYYLYHDAADYNTAAANCRAWYAVILPSPFRLELLFLLGNAPLKTEAHPQAQDQCQTTKGSICQIS